MTEEKIVEVIETSQTALLNELLGKGWILIGSAHGKDEMGYPLSKYSVGRPENVLKDC